MIHRLLPMSHVVKKYTLKIFIGVLLLFSNSSQAGGPTPVLGWNVDCGNHCAFSEFPNNCQGVFYYYPDGTKSYSSWSTNYNSCQEFAPLLANTHIISPSLIQCNCPTPSAYPPSNQSAGLSSTTRAQLEVLRAQVYSWTVCTPNPAATYPNIFKAVSYKNLNTCQYFRKRNLPNNYAAVNGCYKGLQGFDDSDGWHPCDYTGDQISNELVNCLSGDTDRCFDIKDSQDPITGQWYRTPYARRHPEASTGQPLSSRDVLMGILAYVLKNNDKEALRKFIVAIKNNPKAPPANLFSLCPGRPNISKPNEVSQKDWDAMLPDDRCGLVPDAAGLIYKVALAVGLTNSDLNAIGTDLYSAMASGSTTLNTSLTASASTAPAIGPGGYQIGNVADTVLLHMLMGGSGNVAVTTAAATVNNRTMKLSPGYHYLAQNRNPTEYGAYLINKYCKAPRPQWGSWYTSGFQHDNNITGIWHSGEPLHVSAYQYAGGWGPYGQKIISSGQECIAWLDMYLGNGNYTETKCDDGDTLINSACQKFSFTPPSLAAIPGIDYKLRNSDGKLTYNAIDMQRCPYGGVLELGPWPDFARCVLPSGLAMNQIAWNVKYTVDPTESAPGIYYDKVNGACPYGGTYAGTRCLLKSYATPVLSQSIRYWVDTSPSWPGVYYAQINSSCPWGGVKAGPNCMVQGFSSGVLSTSKTYFVRANPAYPGVFYYPSQVVPEVKVRNVLNPISSSVKGTLVPTFVADPISTPTPSPKPVFDAFPIRKKGF